MEPDARVHTTHTLHSATMSSLLLRAARRSAVRRRPLPAPPARHDSTTALVVAGIAVGAGGIAYKAAVHLSGQAEESLKAAREAAAKAAEERKQNPEPKKKDGEKSSFATWFDSAGRRHYEGPFESPMTRREAALILGVRETATAKRIKDAHRRMTRINHPDLGGSAFLTAKVNEAKEMLMKGKGDD